MQALAAVDESMDCFAQLVQMKQVAVDCARKVLGEAGGKIDAFAHTPSLEIV